jgi:hypothetical protein
VKKEKNSMKQKWINEATVRGYIHSIDHLEQRVSKTGNPYISGTLCIATDKDALNVVKVYFYTTPKTKKGNDNATYQFLAKVLNGEEPLYVAVGKDATRVQVTGSVEANEWYNKDGELQSHPRVRGSFLFKLSKTEDLGQAPASFNTEMLVVNTNTRDWDDGSQTMFVSGYTFNRYGEFVPVSYSIVDESGIQAFEAMDASKSNPALLEVWGQIVNNTVVRNVETESTWGAPKVHSTSRSFQAWQIVGSNTPMEYDSDLTITVDEVKSAVEALEAKRAEMKARSMASATRNSFPVQRSTPPAYQAAPAVAAPTGSAQAAEDDDFDF